MTFFEKLQKRIDTAGSLLCIGLDPRVPAGVDPGMYIRELNKKVIDETAEFTACYKPNIAFYEAYGIEGMKALEAALAHIPPQIPVIIDAKRNDIGPTAEAYARAIFDVLGADAVTLNPYLGEPSAAPFLAFREKGFFMLCRTSNPGADSIQELRIVHPVRGEVPLFMEIARQVSGWSDRIGLVVGGNDPESLSMVREALPQIWILAPGIGAQGGSVDDAVMAGMRADGSGILPMVGRAVYNDSQPGIRAREYRDAINLAREHVLKGGRYAGSSQRISSELKKEICRGLVETGCFRLGEFTLKSGVKSPFYIDMRRIQSSPRFLGIVGRAYSSLCLPVAEETRAKHIAGIPLAALPLATAASLESGLPLVYPRMSVKSHGTGKAVEGEYDPGDEVILLDDLITTGLSKIEAAKILEDAGLTVRNLVVLLERGSRGRRDMEAAGIRLHSYLHVTELFDYLLDENLISGDSYKELCDFVNEE